MRCIYGYWPRYKLKTLEEIKIGKVSTKGVTATCVDDIGLQKLSETSYFKNRKDQLGDSRVLET